MKTQKLIYWISTSIIVLFEGVMPAFTSQTEFAKAGMTHLGYPAYFGIALAVAKVLGSFSLVIPRIPKTLKEWAYAGLTFELIFATISHAAVDGINGQTFFPIVILGILLASYKYQPSDN